MDASDRAPRTFFARPPLWVVLVALAAACLHMMPVWHAQAQTPDGWTFTGNVTISPDYMQYRTWSRQALETGPLVENRFTPEANDPYLPVVYYWGLANLADVLGASTELTNAYLGCLFAFLFVLVLFWTARWFLPGRTQAGWVLLVLMGGGLAGHMKLALKVPFIRRSPLEGPLSAVNEGVTFDTSRCHYIFSTLFDTHFLLVWLLSTLAVVAFYFASRRLTLWRVLAMVALFAAITVIHVYEAVTLMGIAAAVVAVSWAKGRLTWHVLGSALIGCAALGGCMLWLWSLHRASGLPYPEWRPPPILFANVVLAFPVAWILYAVGLSRYVRDAEGDGCFLLGWVAGCLALTLAGPYYPYPDRGTMTLQLAVYLVAAGIYFARRERVVPSHALIAFALLFASPLWAAHRWWRATDFDDSAPWTWLDAEHRETLATLDAEARADDLLLADYFEYRWLVPDYAGHCYHAHFFLTSRFEERRVAVDDFFDGDPDEQLAFLESEGITLLWVSPWHGPERFRTIPGLRALDGGPHGTLFRFAPGGGGSD